MTEGLRVIGAGFGRTGTLSLKAALERLGFGPCYHMIETFSRPEHSAMWLDAAGGRSVDWRRLMSGFRASVDWPACAFYAQLMEVFPYAKVVLSVRDPESWYGSISESIGQRPSAQLDQPAEDLQTQMVRKVVWEGSMRGQGTDKDAAIQIFEEHFREVQRTVPADRLLVFNVKEGWQPLCRFLDVEVPDEPFPHLNDRATFNDRQSFEEMVAQNTSRTR